MNIKTMEDFHIWRKNNPNAVITFNDKFFAGHNEPLYINLVVGIDEDGCPILRPISTIDRDLPLRGQINLPVVSDSYVETFYQLARFGNEFSMINGTEVDQCVTEYDVAHLVAKYVNEFESIHAGTDWDEIDYYETIDAFAHKVLYGAPYSPVEEPDSIQYLYHYKVDKKTGTYSIYLYKMVDNRIKLYHSTHQSKPIEVPYNYVIGYVLARSDAGDSFVINELNKNWRP